MKIAEERSAFFDKVAVLNAGALTFSVTLLNASTATRPHSLLILYAAWVLLLIALVACLVRNISHQGYRFSDALVSRSESEIEFIDADSEAVSAVSPSIIYEDAPEPFDLARELKINKENRERWHDSLQSTQVRLKRYWKTALVSEWTAGISMTLGFLLLIVFAIRRT